MNGELLVELWLEVQIVCLWQIQRFIFAVELLTLC